MRALLLCSLLLLHVLPAQGRQDCLPVGEDLFSSSELLTFRLVANWETVRKDISTDRREHEARLYYQCAGQPFEHALRVKTRGNFRRSRDVCNFPPLMLDFDKDSVTGTLFAGQNRLKLVGHCRLEDSSFQTYLLREYLIYRLYQLVEEQSFRVRLLQVDYELPDQSNYANSYAFLIESEKGLARRLDAKSIDYIIKTAATPDYHHSLRLSLFQYMIGNTDWFIPNHNLKSMRLSGGDTIGVPYDFDLSGFVNADYHTQYTNYDLDSPRQRYFRGHCRTQQELDKELTHFLGLRPAMEELIRSFTPLAFAERQDLLAYLTSFFDEAARPALFHNKLSETCSVDF